MDARKPLILTATSNLGIGLFTSICVACANLIGVESKRLKAKQEKVLQQVKDDIDRQLKELPGYEIVDARANSIGNLNIELVVIVAPKGRCCQRQEEPLEEEPVKEEAPAAEEKQEPAKEVLPEPEPEPEQPKAPVCPKCGTPIDDEMLFCPECGEKLK